MTEQQTAQGQSRSDTQSMTRTYAAVVVVWAATLVTLWVLGKYFGD